MTTSNNNTVTSALRSYVDRLQLFCTEANFGDTMEIVMGKKYAKVVRVGRHQRSVHSFVNLTTGSLYKPASWNAPVLDERYNLVSELDLVLQIMDPYGSYLYKGARHTES